MKVKIFVCPHCWREISAFDKEKKHSYGIKALFTLRLKSNCRMEGTSGLRGDEFLSKWDDLHIHKIVYPSGFPEIEYLAEIVHSACNKVLETISGSVVEDESPLVSGYGLIEKAFNDFREREEAYPFGLLEFYSVEWDAESQELLSVGIRLKGVSEKVLIKLAEKAASRELVEGI